MAAAVIVTSPAGAATPECPIWLQANESIVAETQLFIDWQPAPADPAGNARVSVDTFQAIKAFAARCKISRNPADVAAAATCSTLAPAAGVRAAGVSLASQDHRSLHEQWP